MKLTGYWIVFSVIVASAAALRAADSTPAKERIGVYDSRSVAVAYAGSPAHQASMAPLYEEHKKAKAAGDKKRIKELEKEGQASQQRAHTQAFSTAPVDEILATIKDQLPEIKTRAGVSALISKWDEKELAKHPNAEQVDVTLALIDAFKPSERQRKSALEIQRHKPISIRQAERIKD